MKIESGKTYQVRKWTKNSDANMGRLPGSDVKRLLTGYEYDSDFEMWYSRKCTIAYEVTEVND